MSATNTIRRMGWTRAILFVVVGAMVLAACSSDSSDMAIEPIDEYDVPDAVVEETGEVSAGDGGGDAEASQTRAAIKYDVAQQPFDAKIIRDGSIDIRINPGDFDLRAAELRAIAADLGGYVSSGETHIEEFDDGRYAVGWYTLKVPSDRFDDAVDRVEKLGDRVSASLASQDVTEEYVDLEGRLNYWREQEAFYTRLLAEATTVEDLIALQTRMQDVLLTIEEIEGRMRYLESRTAFATLTVGLTEAPVDTAPPVESVPSEPGQIEQAFEQAGEVLLATVSFLIVAAAVAIPLAMVALIAYGLFRLFSRPDRKPDPVEG